MPRKFSNGSRSREGDVIFFKTAPNVDCHIGFFWGDNPRDNKMRHSSSPPNQISSIYSIACFNLQQQRYHSQSVRTILPAPCVRATLALWQVPARWSDATYLSGSEATTRNLQSALTMRTFACACRRRVAVPSLRLMPSCTTTSSPRAAGKTPTRKDCAVGSASRRCSYNAGRSSSLMVALGLE